MFKMTKLHQNRRMGEIIISTIILILIVILSAIYVKYSAYGMIMCVIFLFFISFKLHLFKDFEIKEKVDKKNSNIESAIKEISSLLTMATHSVIISSGSLNEKIWGDEHVLKSLKYLTDRGIKVTIITGKKLNFLKGGPLYKFIKESIANNQLSFFYKEETPNAHFIIVDETHLRLEDQYEHDGDNRRALITYNRAPLAGRAKNKFERLKIGAEIVNVQDLDFLLKPEK